jgi:LPXTG-motif cell wall-anchored protein
MEHPVTHGERATRFLDYQIQEHGDYLFAGLVLLSLLVLGWMFTRRRKHPVNELPVVILPLGGAPKREPEHEPSPFEERPDQ